LKNKPYVRAYLIKIKKQAFTLTGIFTIILWSLCPSLMDEVRNIPPFEMMAIVLSISFFTSLIRLKGKINVIKGAPLRMFLFIMVCITVNQVGYVLAFKLLKPHEAEIVYYLWPLMLLAMTIAGKQERFTYLHTIALGMCFLGVYYAGGIFDGITISDMKGYGCALAAGISWALYSYYSKKIKYGLSGTTGILLLPGAILCLIIHLCFEGGYVALTLKQMFFMTIQGVIILNISIEMWHMAMQKGNFRFLSIAPYWVPILSILLLVLFNKTKMTPQLIIGGIMVSLGSSLRCISLIFPTEQILKMYRSSYSKMAALYHAEEGMSYRTIALLIIIGNIG
jgi:drug/metabolite transporter (DMT)-like permease